MGTFIEELLKLKKEYQIACYNIRYINSEIKQIERVKKEAKGKVPAEFKKYYSTNENNSSLFSILPELCLEYETNFRTLLITFLVNNGIKNEMFENKLNSAFPLLYKLLYLQTSETQATLINLIGGNDTDTSDLGFMNEFSK